MPQEFNILVIDNYAQALENIASYLEQFDFHGFRITRCKGSEEGLKTFLSKEFDLVIIEDELPDIKGDELAVRIQETGKGSFMWLITERSERDLVPGFGQCLAFLFPHGWNVGWLKEEADDLLKHKK